MSMAVLARVDRSLFYVKGGGAWVNEKFNITDTAVGGALYILMPEQTDRWGWTVGAGFEYAFAPGWSAKIEYNYMDFGSYRVIFNDVIHGIHLLQSLASTSRSTP